MKPIPILGFLLLGVCTVSNLLHSGVAGLVTALGDPVMQFLLVVLAVLIAYWVVSFIRLVRTQNRLNRTKLRVAKLEAQWLEQERNRRKLLRDGAKRPSSHGTLPRR